MHIVVSGATKGIGKAIVDIYAKNGYDVSFCARNKDEVAAFVAALRHKYPSQSFQGAVVDMSQKLAVENWAKELVNTHASIDILVNNAGIYLPGHVTEEEDGILEAQLQVNLLSAYYLTRALLPVMLPQHSGHIFNICSIASLQAYPGGGSYSISKFALLGFSENLRLELKEKGIKVTAVMPGATFSDSWAGTGIDPDRIMEVADIANSIWSASQLSPQAVVEQIILRPQLGDL